MEKNLEFNKLADIVTWADGIIRDAGYNEEKYKSDGSTAYCHVKAHELWRIRDVALESIERHSVYTNALNNDIAEKAAKIDLLEKEIEGRKEGYIALKKRMDTDYITIDEHNNICEEFKNKIEKLNKESEKWQDLAKMNRDTICNQYDVCEDFKKKIADLEEKVKHQRENLDGINKTLEIRTKENESLVKVRNNLNKEIEAHESENARLSGKITSLKGTITELSHEIDDYKSWNASLHKDIKELKDENSYLKKELNETCTTKELDLKGHNRREMALVNELADKNDEIKKLKESIDYYKNQERIRTDQLRATERKVDELWGLVNELKKEKKEVDEYVKSGFKLYVKSTLNETEGNKNEANEIITEAVRSAYAEWGKRQAVRSAYTKRDKTQNEKEKTIKWEIAVRLRSEVDKKRIVDIGEGAEKILGVSRELFDAAIKALVDDGYQEIIGRIPQATNSYVYMDMHVLATPDVETKETANAENIKSLDFDIPCGEDAIE